MRIFRERAGVISEGPVWVCIYGEWAHTADTLPGLLWDTLAFWRSDRRLWL
jgi:hypothetical protein